MWRDFEGIISGNGLRGTAVSGEVEETAGKPATSQRGRFPWAGQHTFRTGETYRLEIKGGRAYDAIITGIEPGPTVEFITH